MYAFELSARVPAESAFWTIFVPKIKQLTKNQAKQSGDHRHPYLPPSIKKFGHVGTLTQAGTGATSEMGSGMAGTKTMA